MVSGRSGISAVRPASRTARRRTGRERTIRGDRAGPARAPEAAGAPVVHRAAARRVRLVVGEQHRMTFLRSESSLSGLTEGIWRRKRPRALAHVVGFLSSTMTPHWRRCCRSCSATRVSSRSGARTATRPSRRFRDSKPDLVLLDLMLPGRTVSRSAVRSGPSPVVPIVMLTAKSDTIDVVAGLEAGADDYVTKPFKAKELSPGSGPGCAVRRSDRAPRRYGSATSRSASTATR